MRKNKKRLSLDAAVVRNLDRRDLATAVGGGSLSTPCTCHFSCLGDCSIQCPSEHNSLCASCFSGC